MPKINKKYKPKGTTHHSRGGKPKVAKDYSPPKGAQRTQKSKGKSNRKYK